MIIPSRLIAIGPSALELVVALDLGSCVIGNAGPADAGGDPAQSCPLAPFVPGHPTGPGDNEWAEYFRSMHTDAVLADVDCATCLDGGPHKVWPGPPVAIAIGRPTIVDCLDLLNIIGEAFGVQERSLTVFKQRSARLLALRMHVARYLVRMPGTAQPTTLALIHDADAWRVCDDRRTDELINAAGGVSAPLPKGSTVSLSDISDARANVILAGSVSAGTDDLAIARNVDALGELSPAVWHADWNALVRSSGPSIVDAVESTLRAVFPVCLGANGTPPDPAIYRRVAARRPIVN